MHCQGRGEGSSRSDWLHCANGEFISTLDSQVYKYVKSILIVFSKTGKESIFSDASNTLLTGPVARRPGEQARAHFYADVVTSVINEGPEPY